ncbi:hypothetical protein H0H87_004298 [Tephrocybe sp. NHM501043]|nr:hypothetical protein H0H87_004298 [Tephrocybe sp. NHM501043]
MDFMPLIVDALILNSRGPGFRISDFESNRIIGDKQFKGAQAVMSGTRKPVSGTVRSVHAYINMEAIRAKLISSGVLGSDAYVVLAGPANTYGHYVTTREEYGVQRYEGASTIFGQYTLEAYIEKYSSLVPYLANNATGTPASDPPPVDQTSKAISLQTGVVFDAAPIGNKFGAVLVDVNTTAYHAGDKVSAQFVGANPRVSDSLSTLFSKKIHFLLE